MSGFKGLLEDAILEWQKSERKNTKQDSSSDDGPPESAAKDEDHPQSTILAPVVEAILPAPPPAGFGLPAAGLEPGTNSEGTSVQKTDAAASVEITAEAVSGKPAPDTVSSLSINPQAPPAEAAPPELKAELAFALRLESLREIKDAPVRPAPAAGQPDAPEQIQPAPAQPPYQKVEPTPARPAPLAPESQRPASVSPPAPALSAVARQDGAGSESEPHQFGGGASEKETPALTPKLALPRNAGHAPEEVELKPSSGSSVTPASQNVVRQEISLPASAPPQTAPVSVSAAIARQPSGSVAAAHEPAAAPALLRNNPPSEVTDVSVLVPLPRADSAGDDKVAIRMVQKGAEIHVSVRTPDNQLSQTLRQDLGRLASGLDQAGFRTETWRPGVTGPAPSQSSASHDSSPGDRNRDNLGPDARSGGREGRNPGEQKRRQQDDRPRWVAELEQHKNR